MDGWAAAAAAVSPCKHSQCDGIKPGCDARQRDAGGGRRAEGGGPEPPRSSELLNFRVIAEVEAEQPERVGPA